MTTLGAVYLPSFAPDRLLDTARAADRAGLEQLWLWEDCFQCSGIASAAAALGATDRLTVGVGLMPVPMRNVATSAMEIATLQQLFPDRLVPVIGHGVQDWMQQIGARVESPMTLLREYTDALQRLLHGESVTTSGRYVQLDSVRLDWPPAQAPRVLIGAVKPRTLALAGELAGGTLLTAGTTPDQVRAARTAIDQARSSTGRNDPHELVVYLSAATGADAAARLDRSLRHWKHDPDQDVGVAGDAAQIAEAIGRWVTAGADTVVLQPTEDEPDPADFMRFVAEQVRPLVG